MASTKSKKKKLPPEIEEIRTKVAVKPLAPDHVNGIYDAHAFQSVGFDNIFSLDAFKKGLQIKIIDQPSDYHLVFDMIGVDAPIANAFRRIMLSEVPTMAIEQVLFYNNTSIIQDEVLAHRLGLIPINADADMFEFREPDGQMDEGNTLVFTINVTCQQIRGAAPHEPQYLHANVTSNDLKWVPQGRQAEKMTVAPVHVKPDDGSEDPSILIAKLRPGQTIEAELFVEKGVGKTHAKWSPVATASYRLLPEITLVKPIKGEQAEFLVNRCPMKVYDIEDLGREKCARVARPRDCSMCRECIRGDEWEKLIKINRVRNHFIFSVESTGIYTSREIVRRALRVLKEKCYTLISELDRNVGSQQDEVQE